MAEEYFSELNPNFVAQQDWKRSYFRVLTSQPEIVAQWIHTKNSRAGFVIYGTERHRFLPRTKGCVYEFYILPQFRRGGVGRETARQLIEMLRKQSPASIQLEVAAGNKTAAKFWKSMGFQHVSERYVLDEA